MVRVKCTSLAVLIALTLTSVVIAQSSVESPGTEAAPDFSSDMLHPADGGGPCWIATADALFLQRSAADSYPLLHNPFMPQALFSASDLEFSMRAGDRLSVRREGLAGPGLELTYLGIDSWRSSASIPNSAFIYGVGFLSIDDTIAAPLVSTAPLVSNADFQYRSHLYSGEINLRQSRNDRFTSFVGFRYVDFEDDYAVGGTEVYYSGPYAELVKAHNHLYGSQIGFDARLFDRKGPLRIDAVVKGGLYGNAAAQNNDYVATGSRFSARAHTDRLACLGEVGLTSSWQLTQHLALRSGYQVMWLTGVAIAPDQIPATDFGAGRASVDASGTLFCHGANLGLEFAW